MGSFLTDDSLGPVLLKALRSPHKVWMFYSWAKTLIQLSSPSLSLQSSGRKCASRHPQNVSWQKHVGMRLAWLKKRRFLSCTPDKLAQSLWGVEFRIGPENNPVTPFWHTLTFENQCVCLWPNKVQFLPWRGLPGPPPLISWSPPPLWGPVIIVGRREHNWYLTSINPVLFEITMCPLLLHV